MAYDFTGLLSNWNADTPQVFNYQQPKKMQTLSDLMQQDAGITQKQTPPYQLPQQQQDPNSAIADLLNQMQAAGMQNHPGFAQLSAYANQGQQQQPQQQQPQQQQPQQMQTLPYQMPNQAPQQGGQMAYSDPNTGGPGGQPQQQTQQGGSADQAQGLQPGYGQPSQAGASNPFSPIPNYGTNYSPNSWTNRQTQGFNMTTN